MVLGSLAAHLHFVAVPSSDGPVDVSLTIGGIKVFLANMYVRFWQTTVGKVGNTVFQLFLKDDKTHSWSVYDVNNIPTSINGGLGTETDNSNV